MSESNSPKFAKKLSAIKGSEISTFDILANSLAIDIASLDDLETEETTNALVEVDGIDDDLLNFESQTLNEIQDSVVDSLPESIITVINTQNESPDPIIINSSLETEHLDINPEFKPNELNPEESKDQTSTVPSNGAENSIKIDDDISILDIDLAEIMEDVDAQHKVLNAGEKRRSSSKNFSPEAGQSSSDATDAPAEESIEIQDKERRKVAGNKERKSSSPNQDITARLEQELEQEMRYRDTVVWSVGVLKQSVRDLEEQMEALKKDEGGKEDSEFKLRSRAQNELNNKLEEQISWYNGEVLKIRERLKKGQDYTYDADLDDMSEFDLAKLVKVLERERNNLYGDLRSKSWLLDSQSKDYYHFKELIKAYNGDLHHINRSLEHFWRQRNREHIFTGGPSPMTSPGSVKWNGEDGIQPTQRIIDPRKGPVRKTAGVRSLPRLDQEALDYYDNTYNRKRRTKSMTSTRSRTKSVERKLNLSTKSGPLSEDSTSAEPNSEPSEDFTVESFTSSGI